MGRRIIVIIATAATDNADEHNDIVDRRTDRDSNSDGDSNAE